MEELMSLVSGLWIGNTLIAKGIIVLISTLILLAIWLTLQNFKRYQTEFRGLRIVEDNLDEFLDNLNEPEIESEDAEEIEIDPTVAKAPIEALKSGLINKKLIIYQRLETINRLQQFHIKLNVESLQNLSIAAENQRVSVKFPGLVVSLSMMLGMLGTFIGLAILVHQVVNSLPDGTNDLNAIIDAAKNMKALMGGVKTAFSTTLFGLAGTILATLLNFQLQNKQIEFFEGLEKFTINKLLPHTLPNMEDENVLENITHNLDASFSNLESTIHQNHRILEELGQIQGGFREIVEQVRQLTLKQSSQELTAVVGQIIEMNNTMKDVIKSYEVKFRYLEDLEGKAGKQMADLEKMKLDFTRLPGWSRWVFYLMVVMAAGILTSTIYGFFK